MAGTGVAPVVVPHETLDQAAELGPIGPGVTLGQLGSIGDGPDGAADVVWYSFTLDGPARVDFQLARQATTSTFNGVLSLFNDDASDYNDPYDPYGYRLLEQVDGAADGGVATFDRLLGQGTYYLAVSGDGNSYFNPMLADSGLPGSTGGFSLRISAGDAGLGSATGPQVLTSDPAPGATLTASPLAIRVDFSGPLNPDTIVYGQTVQLLYSPDGNFAADGQPVTPDPTVNFSAAVNELQLFPASPLIMGDYQVVLSGRSVGGATVLADHEGNALGADAANPQGQDITIPFQVVGIEGRTGANAVEDDTRATAQELGDLTSGGLVQVAGAIGDDPGPDTSGNPANQVDLYHFTVSGPGDASLVADVFAGRIGSPLTPGVSLFRLDPSDGTLVFVAGDLQSFNPITTSDGHEPLYTDPVLYADLTPGDYYLAVAANYNTPSPYEGLWYTPGAPAASEATPYEQQASELPGLYDPNDPGPGQAGSPQNGFSTGPYVLELLVQRSSAPPQIVSTSPAAGSTLTQPPTQVVVTFSQPMNFAQLILQSYQVAWQQGGTPSDEEGIYIEPAGGTTRYYPRLESYDDVTHQATFVMLDGLPDGVYELHITSSDGLTDMAGHPIVGNDPSGDYIVPFVVDAPPRGSDGNPLAWTDQEPNDSIDQPQELGVLFPDETTAGVTITRDFSQDPAAAPRDTADVYQFQVLLARQYTVTLTDGDLPPGVTFTLTDASGRNVDFTPTADGTSLEGMLYPGTSYDLKVSGWDESQAATVSYTFRLSMNSENDNAPVLISSPASPVAIQLDRLELPPPPPPPPPPLETQGWDSSSASGPSPVPSPSGGGGSSTISTPAEAVVAIAAPSQLLGGPSGYGVTSTDVGALAASPMGGVVAPSSAQASATQLAQNGGAVTQSSMTAGWIMLGTSLQVVGPGEEAAAPPGRSEELADLMNELRDRWAWLVRLRERSSAVAERIARGIVERSSGVADAMAKEADRTSPAVGPGDGASAGPSPGSAADVGLAGPPDEPRDDPPRRDRPSLPGERARFVLVAITGLAMGTFVRCRGLFRRRGRHDQPIGAGPGRGPHRNPPGIGGRRAEA